MADQQLSNNDRDLLLARRMGRYLEGQQPISEDEDELMTPLLEYKQAFYDASKREPVPTNKLWKRIEKETSPGASIFRIGGSASKRAIWAVAASILIAALLGIFYYNTLNEPVLLAQSEATMQTVTLADGSSVTLRPHSALYEVEKSDAAANYSLKGEAFFEVTHNPGRTFKVQAGDAVVAVLGTRFDLSSWGKTTQVFLERGSVQFTNIRTNKSVVLSPGQSAVVADTTQIPAVSNNNAASFLDWMNQEIIFTNKPAAYVFSEIEQHFNIHISAPNSILQTRISSGGLSLKNRQTALEDLGLVLGGTFKAEGASDYKFIPNE